MNNYQLYSIAKLHNHTRYLFKNCITPDTSPTHITEYPAGYICNSQMSWSDGKENGHWMAIIFPSLHAPSEFFDSRGHPIEHYAAEIKTFLIRNGNGSFKTNSHPYQLADTKTCGQYCLWFLDQRGMNRDYENSLKSLSTTNQPKNEQYVTDYVMKHMRPNVTRW